MWFINADVCVKQLIQFNANADVSFDVSIKSTLTQKLEKELQKLKKNNYEFGFRGIFQLKFLTSASLVD